MITLYGNVNICIVDRIFNRIDTIGLRILLCDLWGAYTTYMTPPMGSHASLKSVLEIRGTSYEYTDAPVSDSAVPNSGVEAFAHGYVAPLLSNTNCKCASKVTNGPSWMQRCPKPSFVWFRSRICHNTWYWTCYPQRCWLVYIKLSYHLIQTSNVHLQSVFDGSAASYDSILARLVSIPVPNTCFYLTELFWSGAARVRSIDINQSFSLSQSRPPLPGFAMSTITRFGTPSLETFPT